MNLRRYLCIVISVLGCFALCMQLYLMLDNRVTTIGEALIRFVSYFTILTNAMVALYFLRLSLNPSDGRLFGATPSVSVTAVTLYITMVGAVYQVALRHIWDPQGWQMITDELLHSVIPLLVLLYWLLYASNAKLSWKTLPTFLIYPIVYLAFILLRGHWSGFYPYYFIDVGILGWTAALKNILLLFGVILVMAVLFILVSRRPHQAR